MGARLGGRRENLDVFYLSFIVDGEKYLEYEYPRERRPRPRKIRISAYEYVCQGCLH